MTHLLRTATWMLLFAAGCGPTDPDNEAAPVAVPEIGDRVEATAFCALYDEIRCASALGCCVESAPYASETECMAASSCAAALDRLLTSPSVAGGAVSYDAAAAAAYLQAAADSAAWCGASEAAAEVDTSRFLVGTLGAGEPCSPAEDDPAASLVCAPGLHCLTREEGGAVVGACEAVSGGSSGLHGQACQSDEDCVSQSCEELVCAGEALDAICEVPIIEPPENGRDWGVLFTNDVPEKLRITAHSSTNSGTTDDITLAFRNETGTYSCDITATIADGGTQECVPTLSSTETDPSYDRFYIKYKDKTTAAGSDDGLRITSFAVKVINDWLSDSTAQWYTNENFSEAVGEIINCEGCGLGVECNSCWIDGDGHQDCVEIKFLINNANQDSDGGDANCIDYK